MAIEVVEITTLQKTQILIAEESHFLDLKSIDISPAKLSRTIAAFANASGGEVYIGIDENIVDDKKVREWRGFADQEAANAHIQVFDALFPLGEYTSYTFLSESSSNGLVLQVTINKTRAIAESTDGVVYVRRSAQNLPVTTAEGLARLRLDKGLASFERETIDIDPELITRSKALTEFLANVIPTAEPEPWLMKQILIQQKKPTVAGVLLFADEPQAILPKQSGVKIYRYRTSLTEGTRETLAFQPLTVEGPLYDQIRTAVNTVIRIVEEIPKMGEEGLEAIKYPPETIHEIITNAVLHRDYSIPSDVHIRIFDNRVEIESPGTLPGHITKENILREQFARNGTLVRLINKFPDPPNKDVGEGLNTAFLAMSRLRLQPPTIEETENAVIVNIKHEPLASVEAAVMDYLAEHEEIANRDARKLTGVTSEGSMKDAFYRLRDKGLIELVPGRPKVSAAWRRIKERPIPDPTLIQPSIPIELAETIVMDYLNINEEITNQIGRKITSVETQGRMRNIFYRLRDKGLIEMVPGRTTNLAAWRKVKDD